MQREKKKEAFKLDSALEARYRRYDPVTTHYGKATSRRCVFLLAVALDI